MPTSQWQVVIDGRRHDVVAHVGYWNAQRSVDVDGRRVLTAGPRMWLETTTYWQTSTEHPFDISGHPAALRVVPGQLNYQLDLVIDGRSLRTGGPSGALTPAKLTGRGRDDEALRRPLVPEARATWALRAVALYLLLVGLTMFFVGVQREPFLGKTFSEAGLLGLAVAGAGGVVLGIGERPDWRASTVIAGTWLVGAVVSSIVLFPPVERLRAIRWLVQLIGPEPTSLLLTVNLQLLLIPALGGALTAIGALLSLADRRFRSAWGATLVVAAAAAALTSLVELGDASAIRWLDPATTVAPHLVVLAALGSAATFAAAGRVLPDSPVIVTARDDQARRWTTALLIACIGAFGWIAAAPLVGPIDQPRLQVLTDGIASPQQDRVRAIFDDVRARTGLSGDGLAITVVFEPRAGQQFGSTREPAGDGMTVRIDSRSTPSRQDHLVAYHLAGTLVDSVAYRGPGFSAGYAYWAAHNELNPFVSSAAPGDRADTCRQIPSLDLTTVSDSTFVPLSLPFVLAERDGGPRGAQDLMRSVAIGPPTAATWKQQVLGACQALLTRPPGP